MNYEEKLPLNDEVLQLNILYPELSIEACTELYSQYGGTAENAANRIIDDMSKGHANLSITEFANSLTMNKENIQIEEQNISSEWKVVQNLKRSTSAEPPSPRAHLRPERGRITVRQAAPRMTFEETKAILSSCLGHEEAALLFTTVYNESYKKLLIIMRGVPGSGKTTLAKALFAVSRTAVICSADNYFEDSKGNYSFNHNFLSSAHKDCKDKCKKNLEKETSPVIIDNTNTTVHDMVPYVKMAINHDYKILIVEPFTVWKQDLRVLVKKNVHGVPKDQIAKMLKRYEAIFEDQLIEQELRALNSSGQSIKYSHGTKKNSHLPKHMCPNSTPGRDANLSFPPQASSLNFKSSQNSQCSPILLSDHLSNLFDPNAPASSSSPNRSNIPGMNSGLLNQNLDCSESVQSRMAAIFPENSNYTGASRCELKSDIIDDVSFRIGGGRKLVEVAKDLGNFDVEGSWQELPITDADRLVNLFPECRRDELLHLFEMCNGDLNDSISLLLDSGYQMTGEMEKRRNSNQDMNKLCNNEYASLGSLLQDCNINELDGPEDFPDFGNVASSEMMTEDDRYKLQGARPKTITPHQLSEQDDVFLNGSSSPDQPFQDDLYLPVDGEDWVDLLLPNEFVETLSDLYGEPHGKPPSLLSTAERNIRLPPAMAFDLFTYLSLNVRRIRIEDKDSAEVAAATCGQGFINDYDHEVEGFADADDEEMAELLKNIDKMNLETSCNSPRFSAIVELEDKISSAEMARLEKMKCIKRSMAQNIKVAQLKLAFPTLSTVLVDDVFVQNDLKYEVALASLKEMYPSKFVDTTVKKEPEHMVCRSQFPEGSELFYDPDMVARMSVTERREMGQTASGWKAQFEEHAQEVKHYLQNANKHKGKPEVHSYYMVKAAEMKAQVKQAQQEYWFYTVMSLNAGNNDPNKIDLHGLSVSSAIEVVGMFLKNRTAWYRNSKISEPIHLNIITGIGKHSENKIPKINPAVREYLRQNHYSYSDQHGNFLVLLLKKDSNTKKIKHK